MALHALSLCAGIGGLDLALRQLGVVSVGYVERDAYAAAVLVARMEEALLDRAPIWSDLATFNPHAWRGAVDLVCAGYPCQPFSQAGLRLGSNDPRHLWPHVRRIIDGSGCVGAVLENVSGHVRLGLREVLRDLAAIGFHAEWGLFTAAEAGAPHRRERLFVLAYRDVDGLRRLWRDRLLDDERTSLRDDTDGRSGAHAGLGNAFGSCAASGERAIRDDPGRSGPDLPGEVLGYPVQQGPQGRVSSESGGRTGLAGSDSLVADSLRGGRDGDRLHERDWPRHVAALACGGRARPRPSAWPPGPQDQVAWARVLEADPLLAPAVSPVRGVADGPAGRLDPDGRAAVFGDRPDRLRCLGNAVSPAQALLAIEELVRRALA